MVNSGMEIVHEGWLLKSPPPKRLWRAKWRNRWFVLRSGELPGQYFLEYYTDDTCKKLKGKIDLDQCEQVDAGIRFLERKFDKFMFDIKTPKRIYYLCAETEEQMNRWVDCVCQVCGLKVMAQDNFYSPLVQLNHLSGIPSQGATSLLSFDPHRLMEYPAIDSPPPSASSIISGPYIPISECITGKKSSATRFPFFQESSALTNQRSSMPTEKAPSIPVDGAKPRESYDIPRILKPSHNDKPDIYLSDGEKSEMPTEGNVNNRDPHPVAARHSEGESPPPYQAPPRPPKPPHLVETTQQNYINVDPLTRCANERQHSSNDKVKNTSHITVTESSVSSSDQEPSPASISSNSVPPNTPKEITDDMYDFPRLHQAELLSVSSILERSRRHCYNNSAPVKLHGKVFSYDTHRDIYDKNETDPRISPLFTPPAVDRGSKPRKISEPTSASAAELSPPPSGGSVNDISLSLAAGGGIPPPPASAPPIVDRNRKPQMKIAEQSGAFVNEEFVLDPVPRCRFTASNVEGRKPRAAPSPSPLLLKNGAGDDSDSDEESVSTPSSRRDSSVEEQIFFPLPTVQRRSSNEIQYLDLDLEAQSHSSQASPKPSKASASKFSACESSVVYKKVDFVKTEAFNKMRQNVEEGYRKYQE